jgi:hypothetical protein
MEGSDRTCEDTEDTTTLVRIEELSLQRVRDTDTITMTREEETNAKIVMLMKPGLAETKHFLNEH